jgi:hypothetical protein
MMRRGCGCRGGGNRAENQYRMIEVHRIGKPGLQRERGKRLVSAADLILQMKPPLLFSWSVATP